MLLTMKSGTAITSVTFKRKILDMRNAVALEYTQTFQCRAFYPGHCGCMKPSAHLRRKYRYLTDLIIDLKLNYSEKIKYH